VNAGHCLPVGGFAASREAGSGAGEHFRIYKILALPAIFVYTLISEAGAHALKFEWDDEKAQRNMAKHGVSFDLVTGFDLDRAMLDEDDSEDYGEERTVATGLIGNRIYVLVFTMRDNDNLRVISLRGATKREIKSYVEYADQNSL
jgi:uncharacterized DUF497 family protein